MLLTPRLAPLVHLTMSVDPFRPQRPPLEPMVINAVQEVVRGKDADSVAKAAVQACDTTLRQRYRPTLSSRSTMCLQGRSADPDYKLTDDEEMCRSAPRLPQSRCVVGCLERARARTCGAGC